MNIPECLDKIYTYLTTTPNEVEDDEPELELESLEDDKYADEDYYYDGEDYDDDLSIESALEDIPVETSEDEYLMQVLIAENTFLKSVINLQTYRMEQFVTQAEEQNGAYDDLGCILIQIIDLNQDLNDQFKKASTSVEELSQEEGEEKPA
jgi:hypothetical protein